jgi:diguanylate cyclase (GGDEF)-like protein
MEDFSGLLQSANGLQTPRQTPPPHPYVAEMRRQADAESQQLLSALLAKIDLAVLLFDNAICVSCNAKAVELFACPCDELMGRWPEPWSATRLPEGQTMANRLVALHKQAMTGDCEPIRLLLRQTTDGPVWCELRMSAFEWRQQTHVLITATEVTARVRFDTELRRHSDFLNNIINAVPDPIFVTNQQQELVLANEAFCRDFLTNQELLHETRWDALAHCPPNGVHPAPALDIELHQQRGQTESVLSIRRSLYNDPVDQSPFMVAVSRDISEERRRQERTRLLASVFSNASEGVAILDHNGHVRESNPKLQELLARNETELAGTHLCDVLHFEQQGCPLTADGLAQTESWTGKATVSLPNGTQRWLRISFSRSHTSNTTLGDPSGSWQVIALFTDITQLELSQRQLDYQARHDLLTGLPNRQHFIDQVQQRLDSPASDRQPFSVLLIDLDDFKSINDNFGYEGGDVVLQKVSQRLRTVVENYGLAGSHFVARSGGAEFAVLIDHYSDDATNTSTWAHRFVTAFGEPIELSDSEVIVHASIGIATFPDNGSTYTRLLSNADMALSAAKTAGKNRAIHYSPEMQARINRRHSLHVELRRTLQRGEITLFYQPKVDARTGKLHGCEALARWIRPDGSMVSPGEFIPIAEQTGLILSLGNLVLDRAFETSRQWATSHPELLPIAVNISTQQLHQQDFVENLLAKAAQLQIAHHWIELEITESAVVDDVQGVIAKVKQLADAGFSIAVDDFGTGYSSLSYLRHFAINTLKIDRAFIIELGKDPNLMAIVQAITALAKGMRLSVVAEGVETPVQKSLLSQVGCDYFQGFLFCRPLPKLEAENFAGCLWPTVNDFFPTSG